MALWWRNILLAVSICFSLNAAAVETITYYHTDILGSPVAVTGANGELVWKATYQPYGHETVTGNISKFDTTGYTGHKLESDLNLVYMNARFYDPVLGRFYSVDPVGFDENNDMSFNRYAYANNNPYKYVDPNGENTVAVSLVGIAVVIYVAGPVLVNNYINPAINGNNNFSTGGSPISDPLFLSTGGIPQLEWSPPLIVNRLSDGTDKGDVSGKTHGNYLDDKPAEGYTLRDKETGEIVKYGETTRGEDAFSSGNQKRYSRKFLRDSNFDYVKETSGTKKDMHQWQHQKILEHKASNSGKRPRLNKSDY